MKPKYVDEKILNILKHQEGFINIASNLVHTESLYQTIISNQLGNTLIVDNIKNANIISKQINFQYKIVSLSGEIVHVGGAITGGETSKIRSAKTDKQELLEQTKEKEKLELTIKNCEEKINEIDNKFHEIDDKNYLLNKEKLELKEKINILKQNIEDL